MQSLYCHDHWLLNYLNMLDCWKKCVIFNINKVFFEKKIELNGFTTIINTLHDLENAFLQMIKSSFSLTSIIKRFSQFEKASLQTTVTIGGKTKLSSPEYMKANWLITKRLEFPWKWIFLRLCNNKKYTHQFPSIFTKFRKHFFFCLKIGYYI